MSLPFSFNLSLSFSHFLHSHPNIFLAVFNPSFNCRVTNYLALIIFIDKIWRCPSWCLLSMLVSAEKLLLILKSNITLIVIDTIFLKAVLLQLVTSIKVEGFSNGFLSTNIFKFNLMYVFVFRFTLVLQCIYFLKAWKIMLFCYVIWCRWLVLASYISYMIAFKCTV